MMLLLLLLLLFSGRSVGDANDRGAVHGPHRYARTHWRTRARVVVVVVAAAVVVAATTASTVADRQ